MGLAILVQTLAAVAVAVALWRQRFSDRGTRMGAAPRHDHHHRWRDDGRADDAADARATGRRASGPSHDGLRRSHRGRARRRAGSAGHRLEPRAWRSSRRAFPRPSRDPDASARRALLFARRGWQNIRRVTHGVGDLCELRFAVRAAAVAGAARPVGHRARLRDHDGAGGVGGADRPRRSWLAGSRATSARAHAVVY